MRPVWKRIFNSNLLELNFTRLLGVANSFPAIGDVCCRTSKWSRIDCYCTSTCCSDWCLCLHCCQHCTEEEQSLNDPPVGSQGKRLSHDPNPCAHVRVSMLTLWPLHWLSLATDVRLWTSVRAGRMFITPRCVCVSAACHLMTLNCPSERWPTDFWEGTPQGPVCWGSLSGYLLCHGSLSSLSTQKYPTGGDTEFYGCPNLEGSSRLWLSVTSDWTQLTGNMIVMVNIVSRTRIT